MTSTQKSTYRRLNNQYNNKIPIQEVPNEVRERRKILTDKALQVLDAEVIPVFVQLLSCTLRSGLCDRR